MDGGIVGAVGDRVAVQVGKAVLLGVNEGVSMVEVDSGVIVLLGVHEGDADGGMSDGSFSDEDGVMLGLIVAVAVRVERRGGRLAVNVMVGAF